jgi:hypothetical protein
VGAWLPGSQSSPGNGIGGGGAASGGALVCALSSLLLQRRSTASEKTKSQCDLNFKCVLRRKETGRWNYDAEA